LTRNLFALRSCLALLMVGCLPVTAEPGNGAAPAPAPVPQAPRALATAADSSSASVTADTMLVLRPGDVVRITVWRNPELSGDFPVGVNGALRQPLYQEVPVAGIPIPEVEQRLKTFLAQYQSTPEVVVEPLFQVVVSGEVREPKVYELPRETSIAMAIAQAGGALPDGRMDKVLLWRAGKEYTLDLTHADAAWANSGILSGDQIIVTQRRSVFREIVVPIVSVVGGLASLINLIRR
jgi:polysaccharide export outer membrane protein